MGDISREGQFVLTSYAPIWEVLFPEVVRRLVAQLVWEVRWDGAKNAFAVVLDETAIAEEHAKIKRREEERASRPKARRGKHKRKRRRV
jgi:hypothetical protein